MPRERSQSDPGCPGRIVVLGMHRSGTSLLTEMIATWGAHVGDTADLMEPDPINPRGYWEPWPLVRFDDRLLEALGSRWYLPPQSSQDAATLLESRRLVQQAQDLLERMDRRGACWVWKDPRLPLLLSFWRALWGRPAVVVPVRPPMEIARSLASRDGFPVTASLLLWQITMLRVLEAAAPADPSVCFVSYPDLVARPGPEAARLAAFLEQSTGRTAPPGTVERMAAVVDPALRRQRPGQDLQDAPEATGAQKALDRYLHHLAAGADPGGLPAGASEVYPGWRDYLALLGVARALGVRPDDTASLQEGAAEALLARSRLLDAREARLREREEEWAVLLGLDPETP